MHFRNIRINKYVEIIWIFYLGGHTVSYLSCKTVLQTCGRIVINQLSLPKINFKLLTECPSSFPQRIKPITVGGNENSTYKKPCKKLDFTHYADVSEANSHLILFI